MFSCVDFVNILVFLKFHLYDLSYNLNYRTTADLSIQVCAELLNQVQLNLKGFRQRGLSSYQTRRLEKKKDIQELWLHESSKKFFLHLINIEFHHFFFMFQIYITHCLFYKPLNIFKDIFPYFFFQLFKKSSYL